MSLWGNDDNVTTASAGIITTNSSGAVTGTGTTFTNYTVGQTLTLGVGATSGFGVITKIESNTALTLDAEDPNAITQTTTTFNGSADAFTVGDRPIYLTENPTFAPTSANAERGYTSKVYGVNNTIQQARKTTDSQYAPTHSGWVGVTTYIDCHGNLRVKSQTYVAMSGITTQTQASSNVLPT